MSVFVYTGELTYDEPKTEDEGANLLTGLLELLEVAEEWNMETLKLIVQDRILYDHESLNEFPHAINTSKSHFFSFLTLDKLIILKIKSTNPRHGRVLTSCWRRSRLSKAGTQSFWLD